MPEGAKLVGAVNSTLVSDDNPEEPCITIASEESIIVSRDNGQTWQPWILNLGKALNIVHRPDNIYWHFNFHLGNKIQLFKRAIQEMPHFIISALNFCE